MAEVGAEAPSGVLGGGLESLRSRHFLSWGGGLFVNYAEHVWGTSAQLQVGSPIAEVGDVGEVGEAGEVGVLKRGLKCPVYKLSFGS